MQVLKKQKNRKSKKEIKQQSLPFPYYVLMIPVIMGFLLPLIVWGYSFKVSSVFQNVSQTNSGYSADVFLHGKQIWLYWAAAIALFLLLCFKLLERKIIYQKKWMIFGGIYLLCSFISALGAEDVKTAFFGGEDLFQGFFVLIAYLVLFYYSYMIFCGEKTQQTKMMFLFLRCALVLSLFLIVVGCFQICGNDPFSWKWVQSLCNMSGAKIVEDNRIYLTLYNSNYVGVMTILLLPLLFVGVLVEKKTWMKVLFGGALIGTAGCLIASGSKSAMVIMVIIILAGSILVVVLSPKYRKAASVVLVLAAAVSFVAMASNKDVIVQINQPLQEQKCNLTGFATKSDCFMLEVNEQELKVTWNGEGIKFSTEDGTVCKTKKVGEKKKKRLMKKLPSAMTSYYGENGFVPERVAQKPFKKIIFFKSGLQYNGKNIRGYVFYINKKPYFITNEWKEGEYYYFNLYGRFVKSYDSEDAFSVNAYGIASYRGYIWSKTIPLLKGTVFVGEGMDHFPLVFPNHDYAAKARIDKLGVIYNKPHSWYLQMGIESGLISLLCMIIMVLYIVVEGIKEVKKIKFDSDISNPKGLSKILLIGLGVSILGYCTINILYDEMIVTAPVFWLILGAYAGISNCLKEER